MYSAKTDGKVRRSWNLGFLFRPSTTLGTAIGGVLALALLFAFLAAATRPAQAQTETVLYSFCSEPNCVDGFGPNPDLVLDAQGNLYGTTIYSDPAACPYSPFSWCGVVFEVTPAGTETVIYAFDSFAGGLSPYGGLIQDASGNFYGTTTLGGYDKKSCKYYGCGVVFEVTPTGRETVLYESPRQSSFGPVGLAFDTQANLYVTTVGGALLELGPAGGVTLLHKFPAYKGDGKYLSAGPVVDGLGNVYGTTMSGGHAGSWGKHRVCYGGCGTVFEVSAAGVETIIHAFNGFQKKNADGADPEAGLILDAQGNLYGTTAWGGVYGQGTVFKLTPAGAETVLYSFTGLADGSEPVGSLVMDAQGNLNGTTEYGGVYGYGTVFKLTPAGTETVLYSFTGSPDGALPSDLVFDGQGNLYGTTGAGGNVNSYCTAGCGVLFKITP